MALITIIDTETTGLDTKNDYIVEAAAVTYDTISKQPVDIYSSLVFWPSHPVIPSEAYETHHISEEMCKKWGKPADEVFGHIFKMAEKSEFVAGHNIIDYDAKILESNICRIFEANAEYLKRSFYSLKYLDTMIDLPYPSKIKTRTLTYLAFEHGYAAYGAHRALSDVFSCQHLISCYDYDLVKEIASTPIVRIEAKVSFNDKDLAKAEGFKWNADTKKWTKSLRQYWYDDKKRQMGFATALLFDEPQQMNL